MSADLPEGEVTVCAGGGESRAGQFESRRGPLISAESLGGLARELLLCQDSSSVLSTASRALRAFFPELDSVIVFTPYDEAPKDGFLVAEWTDTPWDEYVRSLVLPYDEGVLGASLLPSKTILISDTLAGTLQGLLGADRSVVVAPLLLGSEALQAGALYLGVGRAYALDERHRQLVEAVSHLLSLALRHTKWIESSLPSSINDELTGLLRARVFEQKMEEQLQHAVCPHCLSALALIDLDRFKLYTDNFGFAASDQALRTVADILREKVPARHRLGRFGGDEFSLLLTSIEKEQVEALCEDIRHAVERHFVASTPPLTVSIGVVFFASDEREKNALVTAAKKNLEASKEGGGNRVTPRFFGLRSP